MSALLEQIRHDANLLPVEERQVLAVELMDSVWGDYESAGEVDAAWDGEITKRAGEVRSGSVRMIPWETVTASLAEEFGWTK